METRRIPLCPRMVLLAEDEGKVKIKRQPQSKKASQKLLFFHSMFHFVLPEPLSKLLKNAKQNAANTDVEKVSDDRACVIFRPVMCKHSTKSASLPENDSGSHPALTGVPAGFGHYRPQPQPHQPVAGVA